jgi:hypothetical protein
MLIKSARNTPKADLVNVEILQECESVIATLLKIKNSNFRLLDEDEQRRLLHKDPNYLHYLGYKEKIVVTSSSKTLQSKFRVIARKYKRSQTAKWGKQNIGHVNHLMLVYALSQLSQSSFLDKDKDRPVPRYIVMGSRDNPIFILASEAVALPSANRFSRHGVKQWPSCKKCTSPLINQEDFPIKCEHCERYFLLIRRREHLCSSRQPQKEQEKKLEGVSSYPEPGKIFLKSRCYLVDDQANRCCDECVTVYRSLYRYEKSNYGTIYLCRTCKLLVEDRSFGEPEGNVSVRTVQGGAPFMNRRKH